MSNYPVLRQKPYSLWDPIGIFENLRAFTWPNRGHRVDFVPPLDQTQEEESFVYRIDLPGVKIEDLQIQASDGGIWIRGRRDLVQNKGYFERPQGTFCRFIPLPVQADEHSLQAKLANGVLTIRVPAIVL